MKKQENLDELIDWFESPAVQKPKKLHSGGLVDINVYNRMDVLKWQALLDVELN